MNDTASDDLPRLDVIDIGPALRKKRMKDCDHPVLSVDDRIQSLSCDHCGAEIDPWWYLRTLANDADKTWSFRKEQQQIFDAWCERANTTITRLQNEITALTETKNRLWNEKIDGTPLGMLVRPRRKRRAQ